MHLLRRVPEDCPQDVAALVEACTSRDPCLRPKAAAVRVTLEAAAPMPEQAPPLAGVGPGTQAAQPHTPPQTGL